MQKIKRTICPICGEFEFTEPDEQLDPIIEKYQNGEIHCSICGWIYDERQNENHDLKNGFNKLSANEYKLEFQKKRLENPNYNYLDENASKPTPHKCPICGEYEFEDEDCYDVCPVCGWTDDGFLDVPMSNKMTATEAIKVFNSKREENPNYVKYPNDNYFKKKSKMNK